jgi:hypothetical protein
VQKHGNAAVAAEHVGGGFDVLAVGHERHTGQGRVAEQVGDHAVDDHVQPDVIGVQAARSAITTSGEVRHRRS